jgi:hypothetical protein
MITTTREQLHPEPSDLLVDPIQSGPVNPNQDYEEFEEEDIQLYLSDSEEDQPATANGNRQRPV